MYISMSCIKFAGHLVQSHEIKHTFIRYVSMEFIIIIQRNVLFIMYVELPNN